METEVLGKTSAQHSKVRQVSLDCCLILKACKGFQSKTESTASSFLLWHGGVAQLGEHLLCKQGVIGSNPFISTRAGRKVTNDRKRRTLNGLIAQVVRAHA